MEEDMSWIAAPVTSQHAAAKRRIKVQLHECREDVAGLGIDPIPKLHTCHNGGADPQHRLLCELTNVRDQFIER